MDGRLADIWSFTSEFAALVRAQDIHGFQALLGRLHVEQTNEFTTFYTADGVHLASGEGVDAFTISHNRHRNRVTGRFELNNRCISREEVKNHYPGWRVISGPRGKSLEEQTLFQVVINGLAYTFGFAEKAPECLNSINIGPASTVEE